MSSVVIYPNEENGISIIIPASGELTIEQIAQKNTPAGVPYRIIDASDLPTDRSQRQAWEADFSNPDGYGIGQEAWFEANKPNNNIGEPQ